MVTEEKNNQCSQHWFKHRHGREEHLWYISHQRPHNDTHNKTLYYTHIYPSSFRLIAFPFNHAIPGTNAIRTKKMISPISICLCIAKSPVMDTTIAPNSNQLRLEITANLKEVTLLAYVRFEHRSLILCLSDIAIDFANLIMCPYLSLLWNRKIGARPLAN